MTLFPCANQQVAFHALRCRMNTMTDSNEPLASLQTVLALLVEQAHTYERALPAGNYAARAAVTALLRLARQAQEEARSLADSLDVNKDLPHPFSPREHEVLSLASQGLTNKEIAYRLNISQRTVQFHLNSVFNKTFTGSRTEAVALALKKGWLDATRKDGGVEKISLSVSEEDQKKGDANVNQ